MYRRIRRDGTLSEPVEIETLRQWVQELRIGPAARLRDEATGETIKAGTLTDLAEAFQVQERRTHLPKSPDPPARRSLFAPTAFALLAVLLLAGAWAAYRAVGVVASDQREKPPVVVSAPPSTRVPNPSPPRPDASVTETTTAQTSAPPADQIAITQNSAAPPDTQDNVESVEPVPTVVENAALRILPRQTARHRKILAKGTLLRIHGERDGYYDVTMPLGTRGWVVKWAITPSAR